jgi:hypothetical protein
MGIPKRFFRLSLLALSLSLGWAVQGAKAQTASSADASPGFSGRLLATGGVSNVEGSAGGGLTPWAVITGYGTDRQVGGSAFYTVVHTKDYHLETGARLSAFSIVWKSRRPSSASIRGMC